MTTTVTAFTELATIPAYPTGTLIWAHATVSLDLNDTAIGADSLIACFGRGPGGGGSSAGTILQVCDGGGAQLQKAGTAVGMSLCNSLANNGDITFRSYDTGAASGQQCEAVTGLRVLIMARF